MASVAAAPDEAELPAGWDSVPHPWRRYGARSVDLIIFGNLMTFIAMILTAIAAELFFPAVADWLFAPPKWADFVIFMPLAVVMTGAANALCVARWRSTPGKWIFRLRVQRLDGSRLSLNEALLREINLLWWGMGLGVPLLSLIMLVRSYGELEGEGDIRWDRGVGGQSVARVIEGGAYAWLVVGALIVVAGKSAGMFAMLMG